MLVNLKEAEILEKADKLRSIVITPENAKKNEDLRKEANSYLKTIKNNIEEAREEYLKPFAEKEEEVLRILAPLEEAAKDLQQRILECNKVAFKEKVKNKWEEYCSIDGEIHDFEKVYDPSWYGKPEKSWGDALLNKFKALRTKDEPIKVRFYLDCNKAQAKEVEDFIIQQHIVYLKEEL